MGRRGSIRSLPPDLRERLDEWLRDQSLTQQEARERLNEYLSERDLPPVSRSAVNRYAVSMDKVGERMRQSREMADAWIAKLGAEPSGRVGQMVVSMMTTLVYEVNLKLQDAKLDEGSLPGVIRQLRELSLTAQRLERASQVSADRELKIRAEARKRALEDAAEAAASEGAEKGLSAEAADDIKRKILGVG